MDKEKNKFIYGILVGLLIGALCFGIYYVTRDKKEVTCSDESSQKQDTTSSITTEQTSTGENTNTYSYNLNKRKNVQIVYQNDDGNSFFVYVDLAGNAYLEASGKSAGVSNFESKYSVYSLEGYKNDEDTDKLSAFKLDIDKVLFVQNTSLGNGGFSYCIFVLENGEVAYLNYYDLGTTGKTTIKKIDGLKEIASVVADRNTPYVVDINGNEYSLSDYIK